MQAEEDRLRVRGPFVHVGHAKGLVARQVLDVARLVGEGRQDRESLVGGAEGFDRHAAGLQAMGAEGRYHAGSSDRAELRTELVFASLGTERAPLNHQKLGTFSAPVERSG